MDTFPLQNIHEHQMIFMDKFEKQGGISFLILYYTEKDALYYMRYREICRYWERAQKGGRKSFRFEELDPDYFIEWKHQAFVPYLNYLQKDLDMRDDRD